MAENPITRKVGVEIECVSPFFNHETERLLSGLGASIDGDGSIDVSNEEENAGYEIKVGPVKGADGEDSIRAVAEVLQEKEAFVNTSCGLHVHADAAPLALKSLVRSTNGRVNSGESLLYIHNAYMNENLDGFGESEIALVVLDILEDNGGIIPCIGAHGEGYVVELRGTRRRTISPADGRYVIPDERRNDYMTFAFNKEEIGRVRSRMFNAMRFLGSVDPIIRSMIPASRRANRYCLPFEKQVRSGGKMPTKLATLFNGIVDRYCGINLTALREHGTIECRYHNGSIDPDKIIHWARMWARVVDIAVSDSAETEADALMDVVSQKSKTDMLFALLDLPEATEKHLRARIRAFSGADSAKVKRYVENKKLVCAA